MPGEETPPAPFDEQAALEELERRKLAVEESRKRRKDASAAFDAFVGSFRKEPRRDVPAAPPRVERFPPIPATRTPLPPPLPPPTPRRKLPAAGLVAGGVVAVAALLMVRGWRSSPAEQPAPTAVSTPAPSGPLTAPPSEPTAGETAIAADGLEAELTTIRRVWLRAIVDGERAIERELDAGTRVPLRATQTIVIRAGDAGAVRVTINGHDRGLVGEDGIAVTRTYRATPSGR